LPTNTDADAGRGGRVDAAKARPSWTARLLAAR
jgi:hypothetical protein